MGATWANVAMGAAVLLAGLSLLLCVLGLAAYLRVRHGKLLLVAVAFAGFALQGAYLAWLAWSRSADVASGTFAEVPVLTVTSLGIVVVLYVAVLKR